MTTRKQRGRSTQSWHEPKARRRQDKGPDAWLRWLAAISVLLAALTRLIEVLWGLLHQRTAP